MAKSKQELFDVTESFNRALARSRVARGEPAGGIERKVWEAEQWVERKPRGFWRVALLSGSVALGLLGGVFALFWVRTGGGFGGEVERKNRAA